MFGFPSFPLVGLVPFSRDFEGLVRFVWSSEAIELILFALIFPTPSSLWFDIRVVLMGLRLLRRVWDLSSSGIVSTDWFGSG